MEQRVIEQTIKTLLQEIEGCNVRKELERTPERVYRSIKEMLDGYSIDIAGLFTTFDDEESVPPNNGEKIHDQIVVVRNIKTISLCEHHLLPFHITAHVAYLPKAKVIGASKIPRIVSGYAHRLQIQERITRQVANALMENLEPYGVAVVIIGEHECMRCRGIRSQDSQLVTSVMLGVFREEHTIRLEVLSLLGLK